MAGPPSPRAGAPGSVNRYFAGVAITVLAIVSQYFLPQSVPALRPLYASLAGDLFVVYGIPILAFSVLVGAGPLRGWASHAGRAVREGLGWYGLLSVISLVVFFVSVAVYEAVDPAALALLSRQNPALAEATGNPWFWVGFSFVIGAFEETIFRGWIFGFWSGRTASWLGPAVLSSLLFASVHLYYGTTYGVAAPLIFPMLFFLGFAFAAGYQTSGGNLVMIALLHGAYDASAFLALVDTDAGLLLRYLVILIGFLLALVEFFLRDTGPLAATLRYLGGPREAPVLSFPSAPPPPPGA